MADLCAELGKPLPNVKFIDEGVCFHRKVKATLEDIGMHLLTNAIDHGLEAPNERQRQGKKEVGTIELISSLRPEAGVVEIRLRDDGRGLNLAALRARLPEGSQGNISDEALAATVFASGVSTAETLTTRSGRGVGMDAVKHLIGKLEGSIHIAFTSDSKVPGFRPFEWVITLPATALR